jgi:hypothetical protein
MFNSKYRVEGGVPWQNCGPGGGCFSVHPNGEMDDSGVAFPNTTGNPLMPASCLVGKPRVFIMAFLNFSELTFSNHSSHPLLKPTSSKGAGSSPHIVIFAQFDPRDFQDVGISKADTGVHDPGELQLGRWAVNVDVY